MRVIDDVPEGISVAYEPARGVVIVPNGLNAARVINGQQAMGTVVGVGADIIELVGEAHQISRGVVAIEQLVPGRVRNLTDATLPVTCEGHAFSAGMRDASAGDRELVAIRVSQSLQANLTADLSHPAVRQGQLVLIRIERLQVGLVKESNWAWNGVKNARLVIPNNRQGRVWRRNTRGREGNRDLRDWDEGLTRRGKDRLKFKRRPIGECNRHYMRRCWLDRVGWKCPAGAALKPVVAKCPVCS